MSEKASAEGVAAFQGGLPRTSNPNDASTEDWLCWRDGYEQARATAQRLVSGGSQNHAPNLQITQAG